MAPDQSGDVTSDPSLSGETVLVVDDDEDIRESFQMVLEAEGFKVFTAPEGRAALEWLRSHPAQPSLVLVDIMMPGMNGLELFSQMKADPALARLPVVLMTGAGNGFALRKATELNRDVLRKPITLETLLSTIRSSARRN